MNERLRKLIEEQHRTWEWMQEIQRAAETDDRDWTAEERANWDAANTRLDEVTGDIDRLQRAAQREVADLPPVPPAGPGPVDGPAEPTAEDRQADYAAALTAYLRDGLEKVAPEQRRLLEARALEARAQGVGADSAGGFLVHDEFRNVMAETLKAFGGLLAHANVITTASGGNLSWPTVDDTNNVGAILGENTQIGEQDVTFGERTLSAYTYTSKLIRVSWQLLNDSAFDLPGYLARAMGERIGRIWAAHLVSGTGTSQPEGIMTNATVGVTGAVGAPAVTYDNLVDLEHSVDPAYRQVGRCMYGMSDGMLRLIRKVKDADGRPIWLPVPAPGFPPTINGWPYFVDNSLAAPDAGGRSLIFGDIRAGLIVRQVQGVQVVRLVERYADFLQTGWFGFARMDAKPDDPNAIRVFAFGAAA